MRLGEDDRARVPFALVGVILLLGSATYTATLAHRPDPATRPDSVAALNRIDGVVATAVHDGTKRAGRAAAREPVLERANTSGGRVLNESGTFRDYLRLRVYLAVRAALAGSNVTVGAAEASASLAPTPGAGSLRAAKRRVHLTRVDGGLRVRIENVTVRLYRGDRLVERRNRTLVRTVATPVLAVHERVETYERRLNREPVEGPGFGRRLTARLNAIAWARGYAQYGGAPITNVVGNRHVEVLSNGALLATQRSVFGRSDPAGRRATANASVVVGATDVLLPALDAVDERARPLRGKPGRPTPAAPPKPKPTRAPASPDATVNVGVNLTADRAFESFLSGEGSTTYESVVDDVYAASVEPVGASRQIASSYRVTPPPRGDGWRIVDRESTRTTSVEPTNATGPAPTIQAGWHGLERVTRRAVVRKTTVWTWARGEGDERESYRQTERRTRTHLVTVVLAGRHAGSEYAPRRGIETVHERGGPLDGPNLRGIADAATSRFERRYGGLDGLVRRFVRGTLDERTVRVEGERPDGLEAWLYRDLAALRDRVRDLSVTVERGRLGAGRADPAAMLVAKLRRRIDDLVGAPATYGSVAGKARVAVRRAYLERVLARLEQRAADARRTRSKFDTALDDAGVSPDALAASLAVGIESERPPARPLVAGGPVGPMNATVSGAPPYLTLSAVSHRRVPAVAPGERYYPLVARNLNVFTAPYGDVVDGIVAHLFDSGRRVSLRTAARTLRSANATLATQHDASLAARRDELRTSVAASLAYVERRLGVALARTTNLSSSERMAAVREGFAGWETTATRALAAANGSLAPAVAAAAAERTGASGGRRRDWLTVRLRVSIAATLDDDPARPRQPAVNESATMTRRLTKHVVKAAAARATNATAGAIRRKLGGKLVLPPAGLPLAPVPGYWYATTNVWAVTVRGEYARFAVSVPAGGPGTEGLTYERERGTVALDWDGDGERERLGRSIRVSFAVSTAVVVVVPPGGPGVGDLNGDADERSPGWPNPGNATGAITSVGEA